MLIGRSNVTYTKNIITKTFCDNKKKYRKYTKTALKYGTKIYMKLEDVAKICEQVTSVSEC